MKVRITTLLENTIYAGTPGLKAEHGLSFLVERDDGVRVLFDTGQSGVCCDNAALLGLDLSDVPTVVLSHGHYDHAGGLARMALDTASGFTVVAHPAAFDSKLIRRGAKAEDIGCPTSRRELGDAGVRFRLETGPVEVAPGMTTTGEIPITTDFETISPVFLSRSGGDTVADPFADDAALVLETASGIVVVLGCAHRGVVNTLRHVAKMVGTGCIHAIMGGLHLADASETRLGETVRALAEFGLERIGAGHCTGERATDLLSQAFPAKVFPIGVGRQIAF